MSFKFSQCEKERKKVREKKIAKFLSFLLLLNMTHRLINMIFSLPFHFLITLHEQILSISCGYGKRDECILKYSQTAAPDLKINLRFKHFSSTCFAFSGKNYLFFCNVDESGQKKFKLNFFNFILNPLQDEDFLPSFFFNFPLESSKRHNFVHSDEMIKNENLRGKDRRRRSLWR